MEEKKNKKKVEKEEVKDSTASVKKETKKTTSKKTTTKKSSTTKKDSEKKETTKKATPKKETEKKETTKKTTTKKEDKETTKKSETKKVASKKNDESTVKKENVAKSKIEPKEETKKENKVDLEKTIIFDGVQNKNIKDVIDKLEEKNVVLEDKIIKRSEAKRITIIILVIMIFAVIAGTVFYVAKTQIEKNENNQTVNSNIYKKVSKNNSSEEKTEDEDKPKRTEIEYSNIETISLSQFESLSLNKEDMIVLVASETCYACLNFEPVLNEVFEELDKTVYRINITSFTDEETARFRTYYAFRRSPTLFTIKAGIVTADYAGAMKKETLVSWLEENYL